MLSMTRIETIRQESFHADWVSMAVKDCNGLYIPVLYVVAYGSTSLGRRGADEMLGRPYIRLSRSRIQPWTSEQDGARAVVAVQLNPFRALQNLRTPSYTSLTIPDKMATARTNHISAGNTTWNQQSQAAFNQRSAAEYATHLLSHIRPHHRILDVGCGPGSITLDLAKLVPEGHVVGVDINAGKF